MTKNNLTFKNEHGYYIDKIYLMPKYSQHNQLINPHTYILSVQKFTMHHLNLQND